MTKQQRETSLTDLLSELLSRYSQWEMYDHCRIEWVGHPKNLWPQSDIIIDTHTGRFIVEYDEDSDPGRSLIKYWPIIHENKGLPLTLIEVWERGHTFGKGYAELAKWVGERIMELYPTFVYRFIEKTDEKAKVIAKEIARIVEAKTTSTA
ncbi:hypothetical protein ACFLWW_03340 [Chloroflexota bacterium]